MSMNQPPTNGAPTPELMQHIMQMQQTMAPQPPRQMPTPLTGGTTPIQNKSPLGFAGAPMAPPDKMTENHAHQTINLMLVYMGTIMQQPAMPTYQKVEFMTKITQSIAQLATLFSQNNAPSPEEIALKQQESQAMLQMKQQEAQMKMQIEQEKAALQQQLAEQKMQMEQQSATLKLQIEEMKADHAAQQASQKLTQQEDNHALNKASQVQQMENTDEAHQASLTQNNQSHQTKQEQSKQQMSQKQETHETKLQQAKQPKADTSK